MNYSIQIGNKTLKVSVHAQNNGWIVSTGKKTFMFSNVRSMGKNILSFEFKGQKFLLPFLKNEDSLILYSQSGRIDSKIELSILKSLLKEQEKPATLKQLDIKSVMPGLIKKIQVREGETIHKNQPLIILEAMKMENEIVSPHSGRIDKIHVKEKDSVEGNTLLLTLKEG